MHIKSHTIMTLMKEFPKAQREFLGDVGASEIGDIIINHALGAAAASAASGWVPGAGGTAALMASVGFIWSMYYRINQRIGISISKNKLKSLASAVVANIASAAMTLILSVVASTALTFIPGIGSVASSLIMAALDYGVVFGAGIIYLKMLTTLCKDSTNLDALSETALKNAAKTIIDSEDVSKIIKDAQQEYKTAKKNGTITGKEKLKIENDGDDEDIDEEEDGNDDDDEDDSNDDDDDDNEDDEDDDNAGDTDDPNKDMKPGANGGQNNKLEKAYKFGGVATEGPVITDDGWVYCINKEDENTLYRVRTDGNQSMKLSDEENVEKFLVIGEWVYIRCLVGMYKVRTGGEETVFLDCCVGYDFVVDNGWIYFTDGDALKRMNLDGNNTEDIINEVDSFHIAGVWIYYINDGDGSRLYRVRTDGTGNMQITDDGIRRNKIVFTYNSIYYLDCENLRLSRIRVDGKKGEKLSKYMCIGAGLYIFDDWIYYAGPTDAEEDDYSFSLYKLQTLGDRKLKIAAFDNSISILDVCDNWVYYTMEVDDEECLFRIRTDGTRNSKITNDVFAENRFVIHGDWIYYVSENDDCLYRININGKGKRCFNFV